MAQHDFDLANADGATFRADANGALAALKTNNSHASSAPPSPTQGQWWCKTVSATQQELWQYDGTDWILCFTINPTANTFRSADGSIGTHTIFVPAGYMESATTSGPASAKVELGTNKHNMRVLDFDTAAEEFATFDLVIPKKWNRSTITGKVHWTAASGSGGVAWGFEAVAISNDDALDAAWGTEVVVTDTLITANDNHVTAASGAITVGGSPAADDLIHFRITRVVGNGSDTLGVDARLLGVEITLTTNQATDA